MVFGIGSGIVSELIVAALIGLTLFIIFKVGKFLLKIIFGLIINAILGIVAFLALDYLFGIDIPIGLATMLPTVLFGLPAVGTMIILKLFGVPV